MIRLLIADDHPVVRDGLRGMVASEPDLEVVGEAGNGLEALALVPRVRPDVALVDLRMPAWTGWPPSGPCVSATPRSGCWS